MRVDFPVGLSQPRDRKSAAFTQLVDYIYKVLTRPDVAPSAVPQRLQARDQRQMHYQMLPHARPGGIAGLLELLIDYNGRADIYRLADDLAFEIDDLLPIVDAAQLLCFLKVEEGDAAITPAGASLRRVGNPAAEGSVSQGRSRECAAVTANHAGTQHQV